MNYIYLAQEHKKKLAKELKKQPIHNMHFLQESVSIGRLSYLFFY